MSNQPNQSRDPRDSQPEPEDRRNRKPIDAGRHVAKCVDYAFSFTSKGDPQLAMGFEIMEGEFTGRFVTYYGYFTDATEEHTLKGMYACGWDGDRKNFESMKTKLAQIVVEHEQDRDAPGGFRVRVRWVNPIGLAVKDPMSEKDIDAFGKRLEQLGQRMTGKKPDTGDRKLPPRGEPAPQQTRGRDPGPSYDQTDRRGARPPVDDRPPPSDDDAPPYERGGRNAAPSNGRRY